MAKHITKIRPQGQLQTNSIGTDFIKDSTLLQADMALGTFTGEVFMDHSIATIKLADGDRLMFTDGSQPYTANLNMGGFRVTNMSPGISATDAVNKGQLDALADKLSVFEWQPSVKQIALDPGLLWPQVGDRYLIRGQGVDIWEAHSNQIAEFTGNMAVAGGWTYVIPTVGTVVSVDGTHDRFYLWGGASWEEEWLEVTTASTGLIRVGFDIQIDPLAAGAGIRFTDGVLSIDQGNGLIVTDDGIAVDAGTTANKIPQYDANGNLGINTATPEKRLHVVGEAKIEGPLESTSMISAPDIVTPLLDINGSAVFLGLASVDAPDAEYGTLYFNSGDKRLHLRTATAEQIIGAEEGIIVGEEPVESPDGLRTIFTLEFTPIAESDAVYMNGVRLTRNQDYSVLGNTITFNDAPLPSYVIRVDYRHVVVV